jgi:rRNA maturation RNase YbeY
LIEFFSEDIDFDLINLEKSSSWILNSIQNENKKDGDINFIFCSDSYLLKINQDYLKHDTYTDIVTFNYVENSIISGDLFISIDRIKENAIAAKVDFFHELHRVMIHGVLHLIGYDDKNPSDAQEIRAKEDFYLALHC